MVKIRFNKIFKIVSLCLIILNLSIQNSTIAANTLFLTDFSYFCKISDSSNFASDSDSGGINFSLEDNETLDSENEMYRYTPTQSYYDFNFSIGFSAIREPPTDLQFKVTLQSNYAENGTYLEGDYNKICSISLVGSKNDYRDLVYRIEFYPNDSYVKHQSSVFMFVRQDVEFLFSRANGNLQCLIKDGYCEGTLYDKFIAKYHLGVNRTLDCICLELSMNSLQCNSFSINVNKISGELYDFIREPKSTTPQQTKLSIYLAWTPSIVSIIYLVFFTLTVKSKSKIKITN